MSDRPIVYVEDGFTYYRASGLTMCPRAFVHARQMHPPRVPKPLQEAFDYGTANESMVLSMMDARGFSTFDHQLEVTAAITPRITVIGHIDGRTREALIEVKCLNHSNTESFLNAPASFPHYMIQVRVYLGCLGLDTVVFAIYDKDEKNLHTLTMNIRDLPHWPVIEDLIHEREIAWAVYQADDELPDCRRDNSYCPYYYLHEEDVIDDPELENQMVAFKAIQNRLASLTRLEEISKGVLKAGLSDRGLAKGRVGKFKFSYSEFITKRLNTKTAGEYLKTLGKYDEFVNETPSTRVTVEETNG